VARVSGTAERQAADKDIGGHRLSTPEKPPAHEEKLTVSRAALRLELLEMEVRLKDFMDGRMIKVEADIRDLQELNRLRDAAEGALATETERRRKALLDNGTRLGIGASKATIAVGFLALGSLVVSAISAIHIIFG
jgi:hypothetical protein